MGHELIFLPIFCIPIQPLEPQNQCSPKKNTSAKVRCTNVPWDVGDPTKLHIFQFFRGVMALKRWYTILRGHIRSNEMECLVISGMEWGVNLLAQFGNWHEPNQDLWKLVHANALLIRVWLATGTLAMGKQFRLMALMTIFHIKELQFPEATVATTFWYATNTARHALGLLSPVQRLLDPFVLNAEACRSHRSWTWTLLYSQAPQLLPSHCHVLQGLIFRWNVLHGVGKVIRNKGPLIRKAKGLEDVTCAIKSSKGRHVLSVFSFKVVVKLRQLSLQVTLEGNLAERSCWVPVFSKSLKAGCDTS